MIWHCEVKERIFQTTTCNTPQVCDFSIYLMTSNDFKLDLDRFYFLLSFLRDQNHHILRSMRELRSFEVRRSKLNY